MNEVDTVILYLAARILKDSGEQLRADHDELAEIRGLIGYRAAQVATSLYEFLEEAEAVGVVPTLGERV